MTLDVQREDAQQFFDVFELLRREPTCLPRRDGRCIVERAAGPERKRGVLRHSPIGEFLEQGAQIRTLGSVNAGQESLAMLDHPE